jgi:hypothetical protein
LLTNLLTVNKNIIKTIDYKSKREENTTKGEKNTTKGEKFATAFK